MNKQFKSIILEATQATNLYEIEVIQNLWSGYGKIIRLGIEEGCVDRVVVKHVRLPKGGSHPRGWNTDLSHQRKLRSYEIETYWYKHYSAICDDFCRIPKCLALETAGDEVLMVMEDMDISGFPARKHSVEWKEIAECLRWLANFHAKFMNKKPEGLWEVGTYWHLDTRPDELRIMDDKRLKRAAHEIDMMLRNSPYQTIVHGDAKLANFCFSDNGNKVAAVDFQYVGGGCGMKDVAYFVGSCLYEDDCERLENKILTTYFTELEAALIRENSRINFNDLEADWRALYPVAWTDFHRFLKGWSPDHWKINSYSERLSREVIKLLDN